MKKRKNFLLSKKTVEKIERLAKRKRLKYSAIVEIAIEQLDENRL